MIGKKSNLWLTVVEKPSDQKHGVYKYLITDGAYPYTAYETDKGFNDFLKRANVKKEFIHENITEDCGLVQNYRLIGEIEEHLFWDISELPKNATRFTGLSNGSLVDCYYIHTENGSKIYRPNPNAKGVYKPMPLNEHIEFKRVNG